VVGIAAERYRRLAVEALAALAARGEQGGEPNEGLAPARRWLELEPLDEAGHRQVMRLLALAGRRGEALAHYEACRQRLEAELGAAPDERTTSLYERIRAGRLADAAPRADDLVVRPAPFLHSRSGYRGTGLRGSGGGAGTAVGAS